MISDRDESTVWIRLARGTVSSSATSPASPARKTPRITAPDRRCPSIRWPDPGATVAAVGGQQRTAEAAGRLDGVRPGLPVGVGGRARFAARGRVRVGKRVRVAHSGADHRCLVHRRFVPMKAPHRAAGRPVARWPVAVARRWATPRSAGPRCPARWCSRPAVRRGAAERVSSPPTGGRGTGEGFGRAGGCGACDRAGGDGGSRRGQRERHRPGTRPLAAVRRMGPGCGMDPAASAPTAAVRRAGSNHGRARGPDHRELLGALDVARPRAGASGWPAPEVWPSSSTVSPLPGHCARIPTRSSTARPARTLLRVTTSPVRHLRPGSGRALCGKAKSVALRPPPIRVNGLTVGESRAALAGCGHRPAAPRRSCWPAAAVPGSARPATRSTCRWPGRPMIAWSLRAVVGAPGHRPGRAGGPARGPRSGRQLLGGEPGWAEVEVVTGGRTRQASELAGLRRLAGRIRAGGSTWCWCTTGRARWPAGRWWLRCCARPGRSAARCPACPATIWPRAGPTRPVGRCCSARRRPGWSRCRPAGIPGRARCWPPTRRPTGAVSPAPTPRPACSGSRPALPIRAIPGEDRNFKVTYPHDVPVAERVLAGFAGAKGFAGW